MGPAEAIRDLAEPSLVAAGLELWDVEVGADVVRILVDRAGGIDLEALSSASAALSPLFDEHPEVVPLETYQLEVSSPGVERNLRTPDQYRRYLGEAVSVKTTAPVAGSRRLHGTLAALDDEGVLVAVDGAPAGTDPVHVPFALIARTHTVLVWGPAPKPHRPARTPAPATEPAPRNPESATRTTGSSTSSTESSTSSTESSTSSKDAT